MKTIKILDSTLREGQQSVHPAKNTEAVILTRDNQIKIAKKLIKFGIDFIEVGAPVFSPFLYKTIERLLSLERKNTKILIHCRCHKADIDISLSLNPDGLNLFIGTSRHNLAGNKKSFERALQVAKESIAYIRKQNEDIFIRLSAEDAFRTSRVDLLRFISETKDKIDRLGIPDTTGVGTPEEIFSLVHRIKKITQGKLELEFHGHNDRGLALANARAAWRAGVNVIDTTVLGLGERTGIASLSGIISAIYTEKTKEWLSKKYDLSLLPQIDADLARILNIPIPHNMPITSKGAFSHVAGVHVSAMSRNRRAYQILNPKVFGRRTRLNIASSVIGKNVVLSQAKSRKLKLNGEKARAIAARFREDARKNGKLSLKGMGDYISTNQ